MIERVEVLTGGASAVYGSDAIAGVVNFIMKKDFEGVQVTASTASISTRTTSAVRAQSSCATSSRTRAATNPSQFALPDDNVTDGEGKELSLMVGVNSEDGRGNITAYATCSTTSILQRGPRLLGLLARCQPGHSFACGGSATIARPFTDFSTNDFTTIRRPAFRNFNSATDQYNFGPINHYLRPDRRYSLGAMGHYELASSPMCTRS